MEINAVSRNFRSVENFTGGRLVDQYFSCNLQPMSLWDIVLLVAAKILGSVALDHPFVTFLKRS